MSLLSGPLRGGFRRAPNLASPTLTPTPPPGGHVFILVFFFFNQDFQTLWLPCLAKRGRGGSAQGEEGRGKQDKQSVPVERNTCLVGLVPSELVSKNPVLCPSASPTSACHFPAEAMGPRTLLILLVATAWHGKSRIRGLGGGGGERVVTGFLGKDSLNLCPSLGVPTLCFHLSTLDCGCLGVCFGKAVEGKAGMNGVEPAWPGLWISPSSDGDCPCVLSTSLCPQGSLVATERSAACCWG